MSFKFPQKNKTGINYSLKVDDIEGARPKLHALKRKRLCSYPKEQIDCAYFYIQLVYYHPKYLKRFLQQISGKSATEINDELNSEATDQ